MLPTHRKMVTRIFRGIEKATSQTNPPVAIVGRGPIVRNSHMEGHTQVHFANTTITGNVQTRPAYSPMFAENVGETTLLHSAKSNKYMKFNNSAMKVKDTRQPQTQYCEAAQVDTERVFNLIGIPPHHIVRATQHHMAAPASPSGERALRAPQAREGRARTLASKQPPRPPMRNTTQSDADINRLKTSLSNSPIIVANLNIKLELYKQSKNNHAT